MHRNARLNPAGRLLLCQRIEAGWPVAHAAAAMGISRDRAYVWWRPAHAAPCGLAPHLQPSSTPHCHRRSSGEPCQQPGWFLNLGTPYVGRMRGFAACPGRRASALTPIRPSEIGLRSGPNRPEVSSGDWLPHLSR